MSVNLPIFDAVAKTFPAEHAAQEWLIYLREDAESNSIPMSAWTDRLKGFLNSLQACGVIDSCDLYELLDQIDALINPPYVGNLEQDCKAVSTPGHACIRDTPVRGGIPGDIGRIDGTPFTSFEAANRFLSMTGYYGYYKVAPVAGGYVLRKQEVANAL